MCSALTLAEQGKASRQAGSSRAVSLGIVPSHIHAGARYGAYGALPLLVPAMQRRHVLVLMHAHKSLHVHWVISELQPEPWPRLLTQQDSQCLQA